MAKNASVTIKKKKIDFYEDKDIYVPMPHYVPVKSCAFKQIESMEKQNDALRLQIGNGNGISINLQFSFPSVGGVRLCSDYRGFHEPKAQKSITYSEENGGLKLTAEGAPSLLITRAKNDWQLKILKGEGSVCSLLGSQLQFGFNQPGAPASVKICGKIYRGEIFTGLGQRFDRVVRNGTECELWNVDAGFQLHSESEKQVDYSYTNIPLLHSSRGYSLFINSPYAIKADIGKKSPSQYSFYCDGPALDIFYWAGTLPQRLESYAALTGFNILPPKWAFSYWAGNSAVYWQYANGGDYIKSLKTMIEGYSKIGAPIGAVFVEGVIYKNADVYEYLNSVGARVLAWHDSGYYRFADLEDVKCWEQPYLRPLYGEQDAEIPQKYYDFTSRYALRAIKERHGKFIAMGIKGAMIDFADAVPYNSVAQNGKTGDEMHNPYAYFYQKAFKELYEEYNGNDYILFARAGFAGTQSLMAKFLGDEPCSFYGLKESLTCALNLSLSGFSVWGGDIGGLGNMRKSIPSEDCYRRWLQWSAFNPLMRSHGHTTRAPWDFGKNAVRDFQKYYWLRENLVGAVYSSAVKSSRSAEMIASPLMLSFPQDKSVAAIEDEYMFCGDILVSPVLKPRAVSRKVTLPLGEWTDFWTGENIKGGKTVNVSAPEDRIPLFLRNGAVIPLELARTLRLCDNMEKGRTPALLIAPAGKYCEKEFYEENGDKAVYASECVNGKTVITNISGGKAAAVIAKGISAQGVTVDGVPLKKYETVTAGSAAGFAVDTVGNTTTVKLPENWKKAEFTCGAPAENIAYKKFVYSDCDNTASLDKTLADGIPFNCWTVLNGADFTLDLEKEYEIREIHLVWGIDYASAYRAELLSGGEEPQTALYITESMGDEEVLKFPRGCTARRIRFSEFALAQRAPAILSDIKVYAYENEDGEI